MLHHRLCNRAVDKVDYYATLGWIMELWTGAIPYQVVCAVGRVPPRAMQDAIRDTPLLNYDFNRLNRWCSGQLSLEAQWVRSDPPACLRRRFRAAPELRR
jgi:hypothetical protein